MFDMPSMPTIGVQQIIWGGLVLVVVFLFGAFCLAAFKHVSGLIGEKLFKSKRKPNGNGNGNGNGGMTHEQAEVMIQALKDNGDKLDKGLESINKSQREMAGEVGDMHEIITETDKDNFHKIRVMEKKVREVWDRIVKGAANG